MYTMYFMLYIVNVLFKSVLLFKEYSIKPEFRISDHLEYYSDYIRSFELSNPKVFQPFLVSPGNGNPKLMIKRVASSDPFNAFSSKGIFEYLPITFNNDYFCLLNIVIITTITCF